MRVLAFGEILWDLYPDNKFLGGASLNFGAHLAKHGEDVFLLSAVGQDDLGKEAIEQVKKWKINEKYISSLDTKKTGRCLVTLDQNSVPSYDLLTDVAYDYINCDNITENFDVLYFGTLALRSEYNYNSINNLLTSRNFKDVFVDVNIRKPFCSAKTVRFAVESATILKVSLEELSTVSDFLSIEEVQNYKTFAKLLADKFKNLKLIVITLGEDGAYAYDCINESEFYCAGIKAAVVSTVGAGDSFSAAFLSKYMYGFDAQACLEYANKIACMVVSVMDAVPDYQVF